MNHSELRARLGRNSLDVMTLEQVAINLAEARRWLTGKNPDEALSALDTALVLLLGPKPKGF